jgi:hypothetical protein
MLSVVFEMFGKTTKTKIIKKISIAKHRLKNYPLITQKPDKVFLSYFNFFEIVLTLINLDNLIPFRLETSKWPQQRNTNSISIFSTPCGLMSSADRLCEPPTMTTAFSLQSSHNCYQIANFHYTVSFCNDILTE